MPVVLWTESGQGFGEGSIEISLPGSGMAVPVGIEATFQFGDFTFNDTEVIDKYRILSVEGLGDADIRDTRELNPANDGETPYDAHYGGRTIVFNGRIEAYQLDKLRDMQQALRTAFSVLEEKKLYFLTGEPATDHYIWCRKLSSFQWTEEQKDDHSFTRDFQLTLRASNPRFLRHIGKTYTIYPNNIQNCCFESDTLAGVPTNWDTDNVTGDWTEDSFEVSNTWSNEGSQSLLLDLTKAATTTVSTWRIRTDPWGSSSMPVLADTEYQFQMIANITDNCDDGLTPKIWWFNSGGTLISTASGENITSSGLSLLYSSGVSPATAEYAAVGFEIDSNVSADTFTGYFDSGWFQKGSDVNDIGGSYIVNEGNFRAQPNIKVHGGLSKFHIHDLLGESGHQHFAFAPGTSIADADYYEVDIKNKTMTDKDGINKFSEFGQDSEWIELKPGQTRIEMKEGYNIASSINARIEITFRDSWI